MPYGKKIILLFAVFLLIARITPAQKITISGSVKDSLNSKPLPYCNISIKNTNYGTVSNIDGEFQIKLDTAAYNIIVSYLGYKTKIISAYKSERLDVLLEPVSIELDEIVVDPYTWAEKFILGAIKKKNESRETLDNYSSDSYSKTYFVNDDYGLLGLSESVSEIRFSKPDFYYERMQIFKAAQHMKSIPYEELSVNQTINLMRDKARLENISILSPIYDDALDYYNYSLKKKIAMDNDTIVVIGVEPKISNRPLYFGDLYFYQKDHVLMQADLYGNAMTKDGLIDSIKLFQKFTVKDSLYNLPSFTKYSMLYNIYGLMIDYVQEYTFINYNINEEIDESFYPAEHLLVDESNLSYDIDFKRDEEFKVPLSLEEIEFNEKMDNIFEKGSFIKLGILYLFTDVFPAFFDQPMRLYGYNFSMFSNLYRFNKAEGHYLGFEHQFLNNGTWNVMAKAGYAFAPEYFEYDAYLRYNNLSLNVKREIKNLGRFEYLKSMRTLGALFSHEDDLHYYKTISFDASYLFQFNKDFSIAPFIRVEKQLPVSNLTEFSIFNRDKKYAPNFWVDEYNNSSLGFVISFFENKEYLTEEERFYKGESFTNIAVKGNFHNKKILSSTENFTEWNIMINRFQEVYPPVSVNMQLDFRLTNGSRYSNKMDYAAGYDILSLKNTPLTLYTVNNYDFYLQDYIKAFADFTLFRFPEILGSKISVGGVFTYIHSLKNNELNIPFEYLNKDFYEYGITLRGVSFLNFSLIKNNIERERYFFNIEIGF